MYLTEKIAEDYKLWKQGDVILITAPTGVGKSYFIQHEFLEWLITERKGKILYLVNRKILKEQMLKELEDVAITLRAKLRGEGFGSIDARDFIKYETYQHVEKLIEENNICTRQINCRLLGGRIRRMPLFLCRFYI